VFFVVGLTKNCVFVVENCVFVDTVFFVVGLTKNTVSISRIEAAFEQFGVEDEPPVPKARKGGHGVGGGSGDEKKGEEAAPISMRNSRNYTGEEAAPISMSNSRNYTGGRRSAGGEGGERPEPNDDVPGPVWGHRQSHVSSSSSSQYSAASPPAPGENEREEGRRNREGKKNGEGGGLAGGRPQAAYPLPPPASPKIGREMVAKIEKEVEEEDEEWM